MESRRAISDCALAPELKTAGGPVPPMRGRTSSDVVSEALRGRPAAGAPRAAPARSLPGLARYGSRARTPRRPPPSPPWRGRSTWSSRMPR